MARRALVCSLGLLLLVGCGGQTSAVTLNVFAAASLTDAFGELDAAFEREHSGAHVVLNLAGSQVLAQQITQGAPADVFASANQTQMDAVIHTGRIATGSSQVFVTNRLVVVIPIANPARLTDLRDLARPGVKVALADKSVPAGQYALDFLARASQDAHFTPDYKARVLGNVVSYEQDVRTVLTRVTLGGADAGIVYVTDAATAPRGEISRIEIPTNLQVIAQYPVAPLADSHHAELARAYVALVMSSEGQGILSKYGFVPVKT